MGSFLQRIARTASPGTRNRLRAPNPTILRMSQNYTPRQLLAANVKKWMDKTPGMDSPEKLALVCRWPAGNKKAGKKIAPRTLRYMLDVRKDAPAPSVDLIFAVAAALHRQPWELLADDDQTRRYLLGFILTAKAADDARVDQAYNGTTKPA